jgi:hypothetical protein
MRIFVLAILLPPTHPQFRCNRTKGHIRYRADTCLEAVEAAELFP